MSNLSSNHTPRVIGATTVAHVPVFDAQQNLVDGGVPAGTGTVTNTGTLTSGKIIQGNGGVDVTVNATTATVTKLTSGVPSAASAGTDYVAPGAITTSGLTQATAKLLGRTTAATGAVEEISVGTGLTMSAGSLTATGTGGTVTTTGSPASGNLTKFSGATAVTNADLTGDVTTSGGVATAIASNAVVTAKILDANVTLAKIANAAASSKLLGSGASGSGAPYAELTLGSGLTMSGTTLSASAAGVFLTNAGNPQGVLTANAGVLCTDTTNGVLYKKLTGTGNTGWYREIATGPGIAADIPYWVIRAYEDWPTSITTGNAGGTLGIIQKTGYAGSTVAISSQVDDLYIQWTSSTTLGNNGGMWLPQNFAASRQLWAMDFDFSIKILTGASITNVRIFVGLSTSDPTNSDTWGGRTIGFAYRTGTDTQWVGITNDGTTQSATASIAAIAASTTYVLRIRFVSGITYFSVNNGAETSKATNIPTGATLPYWIWVANNSAGGGGSARSLSFARAGCTYGSV